MTIAAWKESVRIAKINLGMDPKKFTRVQGKLLEEAQAIYSILLLNNKLKSF
uniref:Uncharacterized protein n=1 Tax=Mantoniella tinhauana virus 1 TaxID=3111543 RepID=A0AB38ZM47_9VIRU